MTKPKKSAPTGSALSREIKNDASRFNVPSEAQIKEIPSFKQKCFFSWVVEDVSPKRTKK
jgi:hypothetical protein